MSGAETKDDVRMDLSFARPRNIKRIDVNLVAFRLAERLILLVTTATHVPSEPRLQLLAEQADSLMMMLLSFELRLALYHRDAAIKTTCRTLNRHPIIYRPLLSTAIYDAVLPEADIADNGSHLSYIATLLNLS